VLLIEATRSSIEHILSSLPSRVHAGLAVLEIKLLLQLSKEIGQRDDIAVCMALMSQ